MNGTKSHKSLSNCTGNSKIATCDIYFEEVSRGRSAKAILGFTTYSIRGEKTFFKKFTTGQISTLTVQLIRGDSGDPVCYLGTRQFEGETLKRTVAPRNVVSVHQ